MNPVEHFDDGWPNGWEEHKFRQLRRLAALSLEEKLQWLEDAQEFVEAVQDARKKDVQVPHHDTIDARPGAAG